MLAVGKADLGDRAHRIDAFGGRDPDPGAPRRTKEAMQVLSHRPLYPKTFWRDALAMKVETCGSVGLDVGLVFQEHVERVLDDLVAELGRLQQHQHARPVDGLAHRRQLLQIQRADLVDEADHLLAQRLRDAGHAAFDDALLQLLLGEADMQMQAAPLQRVAEIALAVGGQDHGRRRDRGHRAELGNGDLEIAEDFQQQRFELGIRLVDLVDQQHAAGRLLQRLQQRPRLDEFLGEEHVAEIVQLVERGVQRLGAAEHFAELVLQDLRVEKLLGVFPLIERLGLVEPLVALQADHLQPAPGRDRLRKLGLADAGGAFDQDRLFDLLRQIDRGRDLPARDIALRGKAAFHCLDRGQRPMFSHGFQLRIR